MVLKRFWSEVHCCYEQISRDLVTDVGSVRAGEQLNFSWVLSLVWKIVKANLSQLCCSVTSEWLLQPP